MESKATGMSTGLTLPFYASDEVSPVNCLRLLRLSSSSLKVDCLRYNCGRQRKAPKFGSVRASNKEFASPIGPFQVQSPTGLFLAELLNSNPDLISAAVEYELEMLAEKREADSNQNQLVLCGTDLLLYKRIAELKAQERFNALEEILYTLIVQKFVEYGITMVPCIPVLMSEGVSWPIQLKELESVHSIEASELILEHSLLVLGKLRNTKYFSSSKFAHISKKSLKEIYTDSLNYGYLMRRLHNRFQLEKTMKHHPSAASPSGEGGKVNAEIAAAMSILRDLRGSSQASSVTELKTGEFLAYVLSFDAEALRGFLTIRAKESRSIVVKHTQALFQEMELCIASDGCMRVGGKEDGAQLNFLRSKGLVLEAVAFGSFLWDVETYVDSFYSLVSAHACTQRCTIGPVDPGKCTAAAGTPESVEREEVQMERPVSKFIRKVNLPNHVNLEAIFAACQDGLFTIVMPKNSEFAPHSLRLLIYL